MRTLSRRLPFIVCVAATVLVQSNGHRLLFGLAALVAFANLISSQFLCAFDGCRPSEVSGSSRDPARTAMFVFRVTAITGLIILIYALADVYWLQG